MKNDSKSIAEVATILSILPSEVVERLKIIGGYSNELSKGSWKAQVYIRDIEYLDNFKAIEIAYQQGMNVLVERIKRQPSRYRMFTHNLMKRSI
ncbi:hypothetical protein [Francisella sp. SYW-9]|uniref:hypothetical protein n=1 Tax=Francisella sp. SYW-9 TaxID=2610888 RepID=UPI00123D610E|nr:hypothetical protein [Francisella sp. SYW-9]